MIDLERTNDIIRVGLRELPKDKLREELLDILVAIKTEEGTKTAALDEFKELLHSDEIRLSKSDVYQAVEKLRKLRYWRKVLERETYPANITKEEVTVWMKKASKQTSMTSSKK
jgi:hypothetical protein